MKGLDYEVVEDQQTHEWLVWTPDASSDNAVLGYGKTPREAKADAVRNMQLLCAELQFELSKPDNP